MPVYLHCAVVVHCDYYGRVRGSEGVCAILQILLFYSTHLYYHSMPLIGMKSAWVTVFIKWFYFSKKVRASICSYMIKNIENINAIPIFTGTLQSRPWSGALDAIRVFGQRRAAQWIQLRGSGAIFRRSATAARFVLIHTNILVELVGDGDARKSHLEVVVLHAVIWCNLQSYFVVVENTSLVSFNY